MSSLVLRPVQRAEHAQEIAAIRNSGRKFMTSDQNEISPERQAQWFAHTYVKANHEGRLFAFVGYAEDAAVAYGLVKRDGDDCWLTGVISPEAQGKGFGEELFTFLTEFALHRAKAAMLDVLKTNTKAQSLYQKLGFTEVGQKGDVIVMRKLEGVS